MNTEWIIASTAFITLILGALATFFTAKYRSTTEDIINVRKMLYRQIERLEKQQKETGMELEEIKQLNILWTKRYWALYRWNIIKIPETTSAPFHRMESEEVEETIGALYRKNKSDNNET
jgi:hypothetical protein